MLLSLRPRKDAEPIEVNTGVEAEWHSTETVLEYYIPRMLDRWDEWYAAVDKDSNTRGTIVHMVLAAADEFMVRGNPHLAQLMLMQGFAETCLDSAERRSVSKYVTSGWENSPMQMGNFEEVMPNAAIVLSRAIELSAAHR